MKPIYFDHAATTYVDPSVVKKMSPYFNMHFGNPSSLYSLGREAKTIVEKSRKEVASVLGADPEEIIFTGSGTESDNLAIFGTVRSYGHLGKHIIVSKIEHKAVLEAAKRLAREGFEVSYVNVDRNGIVKLNELKKLLRNDTILVSIMSANNEIGTIQPVKEIAEILEAWRNKNNITPIPIFHTDACQAVGAIPINARNLGVDLLTCNGSKIYGPRGIGCLFKRKGLKLEPLIVGGDQEKGFRAGTESVSNIVGFAEALKLAEKYRTKEADRLRQLRDYCIGRLVAEIPRVSLNGHPEKRLPNNVNISIFGIEGESIVLMLDQCGILASTGSACAAHDLTPSHVLLALGLSPELAHGSLRLTFGRGTSKKDIDYLLSVLPKITSTLREISPIRI